MARLHCKGSDRIRDFIFGIAGETALQMYGVDMMGEGFEKYPEILFEKKLS